MPEPKREDILFNAADIVVEKNKNSCRYFYKNRVGSGFFAVREQLDCSCQIDVLLDASIRDRLWTRIILNTIGIEELAIKKGGIVFHSSFIEKDGRAVLFTGPCSIGKSTQANLWNENRGTPIINGDKTYIYIDNKTVFASGLPFSGSSGICKNEVMPLDFIVKLEKAVKNEVKLLSPKEAFLAVMDSCYVPFGLGVRASEIAALIAQESKICFLSCLPDVTAVETLEKFIEKEKS
ncbi:MAG: hypothetical protein ACI4SB_03225 [Acutalibacteraceae bacterium]